MSEKTAWLIERRSQPPQWASTPSPTGIGAFYSDVQRAHRFPTREAASEAMRCMAITPEERGHYFVSEHMWMGEPAFFGMDEQEFEDFLADAIDDSIDVDWTGRIGAKAIIRALNHENTSSGEEKLTHANTYAAFTDGMEAAAQICGSLAETTYDDSDGFEAATGCEAAIMRVVKRQRSEQTVKVHTFLDQSANHG